MLETQTFSRKTEFWNGIKATFPLVVGAIPFGIIFGALAVTSGLSPVATVAMSAFVFAGSSQFIAAGLVASSTGVGLIILTTFVVNLRHALYSATLGAHTKHLPQRWLLPLGFWLTDETFAVTAHRYFTPDASPFKHWFYLGSGVFMYLNWQIMTWIGLIAGQNIENPGRWGLDIAMSITFIGILVPQIKTKATIAAVVIAGLTAVAAYSLPNKLGLIVAALAGMIAGVVAERIFKEKPTRTEEVDLA
jgi:4-azaleucine resistance transporter AzlC